MKNGILIIVLFLLLGCAPQESAYIKDGKAYGVTGGLFRDRWWNYYERGLSFAEGGFYKEAVQDLRSAIERRVDDQWRSRSYGMHFVDYFPHRELGVIHYRTQAYAEAVEALEQSLKTEKSAKAKYFLNKARRAILKESGEDRLSPTITITSPLDETTTKQFSITLTGVAEDDHFVSSVSVGTRPQFLELSAKQVPFTVEVALKRGTNTIKVQATDLTGKTSESIVKIEADREGPLITLEDIIVSEEGQKDSGRKVMLSGLLSDRTKIVSFRINGKEIPLSPEPGTPREARFHREVHLGKEVESIALRAEDITGNVTQGRLRPFTTERPSSRSSLTGQPRFAALERRAGKVLPVANALLRFIDDRPPVIRLKDWLDSQTVYYETIYFEGEVSDKSKIRSLTINGTSILKRRDRKIFFNHLIALKAGENRLTIEAIDLFGNKAYKEIKIIRKIQKVRRIGARMSLSPLPLGHRGETSLGGDAAYDHLISAFVDQMRFRIVERDRIEEVLRELKLSQTRLVDPKTASKIGKIVVADAILTGTVYETENAIEILTRLVDTETSVILAAKDVYGEDKSLSAIKRLMEGLAMKYRQRFPLLEGLVIKKENDRIWVDLGGKDRLKRDMDFIVFREDEIRHPLTGKSLGAEATIQGEARVEDIFEAFSRAKIVREKGPGEIRIKQGVITK